MPQKNSNQEEYISLTEATKYCDYTQEYLSLRARQGKLKAKKFGRNWVTTKEWVIEYFGGTNSQKARVQEKKANGFSLSVIARSEATRQSLAANGERLLRRSAELLAMTKARGSLLAMAKRGPELRYAIASVLVFVFLGAGFVWGAPTLLSAKDAFVEDLAVFSEEASKGISKFSQDVSQISDINLSRVIDKNFPSTRTGARGVVQNFRDGKDFVVDGFSRAGQEILRFAQNDKGWDFRNDGYGLIDSAKYGLGYTREMLGEYTQWLNQTFVKPPSRAVAKNISIATASLTSDGESFYGKYLAANNWVEDKIEKLATIPEKLSNIFFGADETDLAEQEQEPEQEPEQEIEEAAKEFAETGDMEKLQQRIKELEARGYQQKEIIKEVKKITQIQPVQKITKQTNVIDSQALITLASLEDRIDDIEEWEKDIRTLQSITKKLQANPPTTAASTAPIYIGSQGIQVGGAGIFSSLGVSGSTGLSNLGVGGSTSLGSTANDKLTVAATSNFTGPITITNNITHTGAYTQSGGQVTLGGNVDATAGLDITGGNLTIGDTNFVVDYLTGDLVMIGNLSVADVTASGNLVVSGTLSVGGGAGYSGAVDISASSTVPGFKITQTYTGSIFQATSTATMTSDAFIITNLGTGLSFIVQDDNSDTSPFVIAADGKVGIGTSTPAYALDVIGTGKFSTSLGVAGTATTTADTISFAGIGNITAVATSTWQTTSGSLAITSANALDITAAADSIWKTTGSANLTIQSAGTFTATSTGIMTFGVNNNPRMTILTDGKVGIATSTPAAMFTVNSAVADAFVVNSSGYVGLATTSPYARLAIDGSDDVNQLLVQGHSTQNTDLAVFEKYDGTDVFVLDGSGNAIFSGNVTTTGNLLPSADDQYDLGSGTKRWQDLFAVTGHFGHTTIIDTDSIDFTTTTAAITGSSALNLTAAAASEWRTSAGNLTIAAASILYATGTDIQLIATTGAFTATSTGNISLISSTGSISATSSDYISFGAGNTERMRILSGGNVGIATTTPAARFTINSLATSAFVVNSNGYVGLATTSPYARFTIDGSDDVTQLLVQGHSSQNADLAIFEDSAGNDVFVLDGSGNAIFSGNVTTTGNILPSLADTYSLGSAAKEWANLYIGDAGKIYLGLTQDASIHRNTTNEMTLTATAGVNVSDSLTVAGTATTTGTALTFNGVGNITAAGASTWKTTSGQLDIKTTGGTDDIVLTSAGDTLFNSTATFTSTSTDASFALGSADGTNNFYIRDSSGAAQLTLDSNGNLDVAGTIDNGLVAWWTLDEGAGLTAADESVNSNDGTITGHICPSGYALVPGNSLYNTSDFCVMKYEAKEVSGTKVAGTCLLGSEANTSTVTVESTAATTPLVSINLCVAKKACTNSGGHLITNNEWMTIARNIEQIDSNWSSGVVGTGKLKIGNNGTDESGVSYDGSNPDYGTGRGSTSTAKLALSNGEELWDISGNVWEWTNNTITEDKTDVGGNEYDDTDGITGGEMPDTSAGVTASAWQELTALNSYGKYSYNEMRPSDNSWSSTQGMGQIYLNPGHAYSGSAYDSSIHAFLRGGYWTDTSHAGAFALDLSSAPSYTNTGIGFRCVR